MNIKLLLKAKAQILKEPELFDMSDWEHETSCGTAHCIGGWCRVFSRKKDKDSFKHRDILKLSYDQAESLFYLMNWPARFRSKYCKANSKNKARIAAKYIDYFIKKYGKE